MAKKTWIETAINGAWTRRLQPNIPVTAQEVITEGVACVKAGAAVVHAHTLDPDTGKQNNNLENCIWNARYATTVELASFPCLPG